MDTNPEAPVPGPTNPTARLLSRLRAPAADGLRRFPWRSALLLALILLAAWRGAASSGTASTPSPPARPASPSTGLTGSVTRRLRRRPLPPRVVYRPRADPDLRPAPLRTGATFNVTSKDGIAVGLSVQARWTVDRRSSRRSGPRFPPTRAGTSWLRSSHPPSARRRPPGTRPRFSRRSGTTWPPPPRRPRRRGSRRPACPEGGPRRRREAPRRVRARPDGAPRRVPAGRRGRGEPPAEEAGGRADPSRGRGRQGPPREAVRDAGRPAPDRGEGRGRRDGLRPAAEGEGGQAAPPRGGGRQGAPDHRGRGAGRGVEDPRRGRGRPEADDGRRRGVRDPHHVPRAVREPEARGGADPGEPRLGREDVRGKALRQGAGHRHPEPPVRRLRHRDREAPCDGRPARPGEGVERNRLASSASSSRATRRACGSPRRSSRAGRCGSGRKGTPDPTAEVVLGETLEEMARRGIPPPDGARFLRRPDFAKNRTVEAYDGEAFRLALGSLPADPDSDRLREVRERASAGALRPASRSPRRRLVGLWMETAAWLALVEESRTRLRRLPMARGGSPPRRPLSGGSSSRRDGPATSRRSRGGSRRRPGGVRLDLPKDAAGPRLVLAATVVRRMRGDGRPVPAGGLGRTGAGRAGGADRGRDRAARARRPGDDGRTGRTPNGFAEILRAVAAGARFPPRLARRPPGDLARGRGPGLGRRNRPSRHVGRFASGQP